MSSNAYFGDRDLFRFPVFEPSDGNREGDRVRRRLGEPEAERRRDFEVRWRRVLLYFSDRLYSSLRESM
jgi:hypothetical protein